MNTCNKNHIRLGRKAFTIMILGLMCMSGFSGIIKNVRSDGSGNYPPPEDGDWVITNDTVVWNETILLNGNLIIRNGGNLTLRNVTLEMDCSSDGEFGIEVQDGGEFHILDYDMDPGTPHDRSIITAVDSEYEFTFLVKSGSLFEMRNSELSECGYNWNTFNGRSGLTIKTDNTIIENSTFQRNCLGVFIYQSNGNQIIGNTIIDNADGIYLTLSNNNIIEDNKILNSTDYNGLTLWDSHYTEISRNVMEFCNMGIQFKRDSDNIEMRDNELNNNTYNFGVCGGYNDIDTSNTANGKPIYYVHNQHDLIYDNATNIGYLGFSSCSNIWSCPFTGEFINK